MATKALATVSSGSEAAGRIASAILSFVADIPKSKQRRSRTPGTTSRGVANSAAAGAALAAGALALPPGPLGWITILPEMVTVWKIQAQMVSDIATLHGRKSALTQEQMLYCLFRHTAAQAVRDLVVRVGERTLVQSASLRVLQNVAQKVGVKMTQRAIGKGLTRWLPIVGAVGVGAYAYYDTVQVASTAIEIFERDAGVGPEAAKEA